MRVVNGSLMVCLAYSIGKQNVKIIEKYKSKLKNLKMNYSRCHRY